MSVIRECLLAVARATNGRDLVAPAAAALPAGVDTLAGVQTLVSSLQQVLTS